MNDTEERHQANPAPQLPRKTLSPEEVAGYGIPSHFVNNFKISLNAQFCKLSLGEFTVGDPDKDAQHYHAFTMPTEDIIRLAQVVLSTVQRMQAAARVQKPLAADIARFNKKAN